MKYTPAKFLLPCWLAFSLIFACSQTNGGLHPGKSTLPEVVAQMGQPSMIWSDEHGNLVVEFSRLPGQQQNFMARFSQDGLLISLEQVLTESRVVNLREGMSREEVRRLIGRPGSIEQELPALRWEPDSTALTASCRLVRIAGEPVSPRLRLACPKPLNALEIPHASRPYRRNHRPAARAHPDARRRMGTMIQQYKLSERDYRGERFLEPPERPQGQQRPAGADSPGLIAEVHRAYLDAGADIIETNTFNATRVSQAEYGLESSPTSSTWKARVSRARCATNTPRRTRPSRASVAGVIGPTSRTLSLSPDVNDPGFRNISFDALMADYYDSAKGLGRRRRPAADRDGVRHAQRQGRGVRDREVVRGRRPAPAGDDLRHHHRRVRAHAVGPDRQAFWNSLAHARPMSFGLNCALGAKELRQYVEELRTCATPTSPPTPTPACPTRSRPPATTRRPSSSPAHREWAESGLVNIVGGCCGTTPAHIAAVAERSRGSRRASSPISKCAAPLRPGALHDWQGQPVRERRRAHQRHRLARVRR
jgi:methionine synthase I (cobalamin-dependent)